MEDITNKSKSKADSSRIPSPGSVSSVHSIRPLEWDSGADIGYQRELSTGLSTVERIALVSGTVNLLETCQTRSSTSSTTCRTQQFTNPLAHSSPFTSSVSTHSKSEDANTIQQVACRPLVDYSFSSDHSVDQSQNTMNTDSRLNVRSEVSVRNDIKASMEGSSRSLEDLRCLRRLHKFQTSSRSHSSSNILASLSRKNKKHNSSSSVATVIPQVEQISDPSNSNSPRFVEKGVQVDEAILNLILFGEKTSLASSSSKGSLEFFHRFYQNKTNAERSCSTYTIDDDQNSHRNDDESGCQSNGESLDDGSFKYVPGSAYDNDIRQESSSDVNTMCSEVVDGVDLITRYVDNLRVSNKRKIVEKMARFLMSNVANKSASEEALIQRSSENSRSHNSPRRRIKLQHRPSSSSSRILKSNSENDTMPRDSHDGSLKSQSQSPILLSEAIKSVEGSDRNQSEPSMNNFSRNGTLSTTSDYTRNSSSDSKIPKSKCDKDSQSVNISSLKRFLAKEREAQLLWIESGISHLNNLKKLYESHRQLKINLNEFKKKSSGGSISVTSNRDCELITTVGNASSKMKTTHKASRKSRSPQPSGSVTEPKLTVDDSSTMTDQSADFMRLDSSKSAPEKWSSKDGHHISLRVRNHRRMSEDKENIYKNSNDSNRSKIHETKVKCGKRKPPVSYTVLFDRKPETFANQTFMIKDRIVRTSAKKVLTKSNKMTKTPSASKLDCSADNFANQRSLQDYLLRNKPEYVYKAEFRRHCLSEIAKLRDLRDKSRDELISAMQQSQEITTRVNIPPPPLTVLKIFDDKLMKRETAKKYERLPEIVNKKMELKRSENYRRNQIMARIFTKNLQKKVLKGQVNLSNNANVISF